jgi:hypothetical protein
MTDVVFCSGGLLTVALATCSATRATTSRSTGFATKEAIGWAITEQTRKKWHDADVTPSTDRPGKSKTDQHQADYDSQDTV